ncbi:hypothetical protein ANN_17176 [Periplaneta americana]|uniref:Uncharacterized protein n=1 Tax=Periplaneta americana TaxID=6978 RepID=A0ABQ8STL9_PERAM|nr:hypothetical protein ANN_17176 [Periplaneta americana]
MCLQKFREEFVDKDEVILRRFINILGCLASEFDEGDNAGEMNPGSSIESYPAFAHIGLRGKPRKNLNQALVHTGRFSRVVYRLPIHGHSYLPNDWDFGTVKRSPNKVDRHYTVRDVREIIVSASHKFHVKLVKIEDILDFQTWCSTMYKKSPVSEESQVHRLKNSKKGKRNLCNINSYHEFI